MGCQERRPPDDKNESEEERGSVELDEVEDDMMDTELTAAQHGQLDLRVEGRTARLLASIPSSWAVVHDVSLGAERKLEHLVIGPPGVFAINTRIVGGKVWIASELCLIDGERRSLIPGARRDAFEVRQRLASATGQEVWVESIIVFVRPKQLEIKQRSVNVTALTDDELLTWMGAQRPRYDERLVQALARAARDPATWR